MQWTLDRVPLAQMTAARFEAEHHRPERPVLITGVDVGDAASLTFEQFRDRYLPGAERRLARYDAALPTADETDTPFPALVRQVLSRPDVVVRARPMRLWAHARGHYTLFHYDGNSVDSLNLLIKGHKRWRLVSPATPLPTVPFGLSSLVGEAPPLDPRRHDYCEVDARAGDMLFVPRYWIHEVVSHGELNLGLNWVWTPRWPSDTALGRREAELLSLRRVIPPLEWIAHNPIGRYGGDGSMVAAYTRDVRARAMLRRLAEELAQTPRLLRSLPGTVQRVARLRHGNFNVPTALNRAEGREP